MRTIQSVFGGQRHERRLKENCKVRYYNLIASGKLNSYLHNIDLLARETENRLIDEVAIKQSITEELKANDMMTWVGAINNIKNQVREIITSEIIYRKFQTVYITVL